MANRVALSNSKKMLWFFCPGCLIRHAVYLGQMQGKSHPLWNWNGDLKWPVLTGKTGTSSIGVCHNNQGGFGCHSFVGTQGAKPGYISFCPDCDHELAGQKVLLPYVSWGLARKFATKSGRKNIWEGQLEKGLHYKEKPK